MTNSKKTLIELLHGSLTDWEELPEQIAKEDMYLEDGFHVDTEFMTAILSHMNHIVDVEMRVMKALQHLLGADEDDVKPKKSADKGAVWTVERVLKESTLKDNIMYPPKLQLNKSVYAKYKQYIEEAGGSWNTSKQGFTFPFDATRVFGILNSGKRCNLKQDFQYFSTPSSVADRLCKMFSSITPDMKILEPSAGTGSLVTAVLKLCPEAVVDCYELMPENRELLQKQPGVRIVGEDFSKCENSYDRIIANPPFAKNQDVVHATNMYKHLNEGGEMAVITSRHWRFAEERICQNFRKWLSKVDALIEDIDEGEFKESGTSISTTLIFIKK